MTNELKISSNVIDFLRILHEANSVFEIRGLLRRKRIAFGYFQDAEKAGKAIAALERRQPIGIYATLNPCQADLLGRANSRISTERSAMTADKDIVKRRWLFVDIDPTRPAGVSSTHHEMTAALKLATHVRRTLCGEGWPEPVLGMSGNGAYLLYRVELPNDEPSKTRMKKVLRGLAHRFDTPAAKIDTTTYNASRLVKVLGTWVRKGEDLHDVEDMPDRPHRQSWYVPPIDTLRIVTSEQLTGVQKENGPAETTEDPSPPPAFDAQAGIGYERCVKYLGRLPNAVQGEKGSNVTFRAACVCWQFGLDASQVRRAMNWFNAAKCEPAWNAAELEHKIESARKSVEEAGTFGSKGRGKTGGGEPSAGKVRRGTERHLTDHGNAERLIDQFGRDLCYCHPWQTWLIYDGQRWERDVRGGAKRLAMKTVRAIYSTLADVADKEKKDAVYKHAKASESQARNEAMLAMARSMVPIVPDEIDRDPWLFNCQNGTVDLRCGKLRPHNRNDKLMACCPTKYRPHAAAPVWQEFLASTFGPGGEEQIGFLRRWLGYCLTGDVREHLLPIFWGVGANGKSVLLGAIQDTLGGDYAITASADLLMVHSGTQHPTGMADLFGRRLVVCSEMESGRRLNESLVKQITGGDRIRARRMREDFWEFDPTHKTILITNHKPRVRGTDHAIWRRLTLVPFTRSFWNAEKGESGPDHLRADKMLRTRLQAERQGILAWCVQGCLEWQRDGLRVPAQVIEATKEFRAAEDAIGRFLADRCDLDAESTTKTTALYEAYRKWCDASGEYPMSLTRFGEKLTERGYTVQKCNDANYRKGLALVPEQQAFQF